ncbi:MAG: hypothetical protein AWU57_2512 [Marinobacter sp. T13-3]|nr:MAG: hypothetical protein AWU57_2512 [Marinobacter sp. T13-3]
MSVNKNLQVSNIENIPFMGSGKILVKKEVEVCSKVIVKDLSGIEHTVSILKFDSTVYTGVTGTGMKMEFGKENVFLIL